MRVQQFTQKQKKNKSVSENIKAFEQNLLLILIDFEHKILNIFFGCSNFLAAACHVFIIMAVSFFLSKNNELELFYELEQKKSTFYKMICVSSKCHKYCI